MTGTLGFQGVVPDITTFGNEDLTIDPGGTGDVVILGSLGIGTSNISASSILELSGDDKALRLTRVSSVTAVVDPRNGMLVYDSSYPLWM